MFILKIKKLNIAKDEAGEIKTENVKDAVREVVAEENKKKRFRKKIKEEIKNQIVENVIEDIIETPKNPPVKQALTRDQEMKKFLDDLRR